MRRGSGTLALLGALAALWGCAVDPRPVPEGPSVLLVTIDTLRADHVGAYGHAGARTPVMDGLAARGVRFARAFATAPLTLPSHASILTGLYPPRHGVRNNGMFRLDAGQVTLAERLSRLGYDTAAVVGAFVLERRYGLDQGFATYDDVFVRKASGSGFLERPAGDVADRAIAWLEEHAGGRPFFLWTHFFDPHADYVPPPSYAADFPGAPYDGEIAYSDAQLGRILDWLGAHGHDDVLVVVTADHGESLGEHRETTHAYGLYDATLAVPLLVSGPGVPRGVVVDRVVSNAGITPLVLERVGAALPEDLDGEPLARFWRDGPAPRPRPVYAETLATKFAYGWAPLFAMRSERHHYVRAPRAELYDVAADPAQRRNLLSADAPDDPSLAAVVHPLEARLDAILGEAPADVRGSPLDAEERASLEALGYVVGEASPAADGAAAMDPKDGLLWHAVFEEGRRARAEGDYERAEALLARALAHVPDSVNVLHEYALLETDLGRYAEALAHAKRAVALSPGSAAESRALIGVIALETNDEERAARMLESAKQRSTSATPVAEVGFLWLEARRGDLEAALAHEAEARRLLAGSPPGRRASALLSIAQAWERLGHYDRALLNVRDALAEDPGNEEAHMEMAIHAARSGDDEAVARHLEAAGEARREPRRWNRLAIVHAARGELARAERELRGLLQAHPGYALARKNLALVRRKTVDSGG